METIAMMNPFVVGRYVSDKYFCDREGETSFLIKQIENGRNVALISPRRLGKTGLIQHLFHQESIEKNYHAFFVDIYATTSLTEFVYLLGKAIYDELKPKKTVWTERFFQIITSLRAGFKLDMVTGEPSFDIGLGDIQAPQTTLDEIFAYLETADKPCIVAIDEFQQIGGYEEKNVEALLRTKIQQCKQTMFKKGHTPANRMKVGEYTYTTDGYLKLKVKDEGTQNERFVFVHRKVWEEHNGPIPPGHKIIFLDGNKDNCDISNLAMVDNAEALEMYRRNLRTDDTELTRTGLAVAKINIAARKRKKGEK